MHSHSGQFCPGHAEDQLEDIILHAIKVGYKTIGLTEHMPRTHLLPTPEISLMALAPRHAAYLAEARRLQAYYAPQIHILIAFEGEWIRPAYGPLIRSLDRPPRPSTTSSARSTTSRGVPIDYDDSTLCEGGGGLWCRVPGRELKGGEWPGVWERVVRNLEFVKGYGGWLECNTSGLRKKLPEPYPKREIAEEWTRMGGRWTFGDDSHGIAQVGTNYWKGLGYLESLGVRELWTLERRPVAGADGGVELVEKAVPIEEFRASLKLE
ncbi:hypothetical protein CHGG_03979 [Chaetomium globosum CBS 148.51]|uniref:Histidinol-phosphatase n=1 Tax=Chaetomium globosum (strain ATCC 6205 / CBS 148.51 / DSM 1962 / NBRC 6347 / NRRL 1970) TaxID=306901 RepID=Q2H2L7_CHAGB|nr:uncharacterized protein CHGG_03979 [Chaetomium globosum CBS 148.51]EAQ87360.1 hypothetical protein CHGG_03979 [Chaetomium globosum CBS 148.51]